MCIYYLFLKNKYDVGNVPYRPCEKSLHVATMHQRISAGV
jgi:hypothetical protein